MKIGLSAPQYFASPNEEICAKMKTNTPIDREYHALSVSKNNSVPNVDLHFQNLIFVRIAKKHGKSEISFFQLHRIAMCYTPLERALKTEQNGVFEVRISSVFHVYFLITFFVFFGYSHQNHVLETMSDFGNGLFRN